MGVAERAAAGAMTEGALKVPGATVQRAGDGCAGEEKDDAALREPLIVGELASFIGPAACQGKCYLKWATIAGSLCDGVWRAIGVLRADGAAGRVRPTGDDQEPISDESRTCFIVTLHCGIDAEACIVGGCAIGAGSMGLALGYHDDRYAFFCGIVAGISGRNRMPSGGPGIGDRQISPEIAVRVALDTWLPEHGSPIEQQGDGGSIREGLASDSEAGTARARWQRSHLVGARYADYRLWAGEYIRGIACETTSDDYNAHDKERDDLARGCPDPGYRGFGSDSCGRWQTAERCWPSMGHGDPADLGYSLRHWHRAGSCWPPFYWHKWHRRVGQHGRWSLSLLVCVSNEGRGNPL